MLFKLFKSLASSFAGKPSDAGIHVVRFDNGKYAVRKRSFGTSFQYAGPSDYESRGFYWWPETCKNYAWVDTLDEAKSRMAELQDVGIEIDMGTPV
jgi:hypothetical protein